MPRCPPGLPLIDDIAFPRGRATNLSLPGLICCNKDFNFQNVFLLASFNLTKMAHVMPAYEYWMPQFTIHSQFHQNIFAWILAVPGFWNCLLIKIFPQLNIYFLRPPMQNHSSIYLDAFISEARISCGSINRKVTFRKIRGEVFTRCGLVRLNSQVKIQNSLTFEILDIGI